MPGLAEILEKKYAGRPDGVACFNFSIEKPAIELLYHYSEPGRRTMGKFISRLVFEHHAREEAREEEDGAGERQKLRLPLVVRWRRRDTLRSLKAPDLSCPLRSEGASGHLELDLSSMPLHSLQRREAWEF